MSRVFANKTRVRLRPTVSADSLFGTTPTQQLPPPPTQHPPPDAQTTTSAAQPGEQSSSTTALLDVSLAPPTKKRQRTQISDSLPKFQQRAGNVKVWQRLLDIMRGKKNNLIMLHGPHGCGKTRGLIEVCNTTLGMHVYEVNAANVIGIEETVKKIVSVCRTKTLMGPRVALIDDIEGFDETYVTAFTSMIKKRHEDDGILVITCCDPYTRSIVGLRSITTMERLRFYEPSSKAMASAAQLIRTDLSGDTIRRHASEACGNFHQLFLRLRTFIESKPDEHVGLLDTTQQLITRNADVEKWARSADHGVLSSLLYNNTPEIVMRGEEDDELYRMKRMLELFSCTTTIPDEERIFILGTAARTLLKLPNGQVPPLRMPKPLTIRHDPATDRDIPRLLRENRRDESES